MSWNHSLRDNFRTLGSRCRFSDRGKDCDLFWGIAIFILETKNPSLYSFKFICSIKRMKQFKALFYGKIIICNYLSISLRIVWYCATKSKYRIKLYIKAARGEEQHTYPPISNVWSSGQKRFIDWFYNKKIL